MELQSVYEQFDFSDPTKIIESQKLPVPFSVLRQQRIPGFICPSSAHEVANLSCHLHPMQLPVDLVK